MIHSLLAVMVSMIASLTAESDGDKTDLTLTSWTLDFSTFSYNDAPFAGATLTDENGAVLGVTDENGCLTVKKTSGIAKLDGVAAISLGSEDKNEVRVTVNVDGATKILARPVTLEGEQTVEGVLKAAHELYYEGGPDGFAAGLDATWNMFLITKFWGVSATPYVILNGAPLGGGENAMLTADAASVAAGDNIIVTVFSPGYTQPSAAAHDVVFYANFSLESPEVISVGPFSNINDRVAVNFFHIVPNSVLSRSMLREENLNRSIRGIQEDLDYFPVSFMVI